MCFFMRIETLVLMFIVSIPLIIEINNGVNIMTIMTDSFLYVVIQSCLIIETIFWMYPEFKEE